MQSSPVDASTVVSTNPNAVYSASGQYEPLANAFDGDLDTWWNAPDYAPEWIEVDLGGIYSLTSFDLLTSQRPNGNTTHEIYVDRRLVHVISGYTVDNQWLQFVPATPIVGRYVTILTTSSPSWVGWREVQVSGDPWVPPPPPPPPPPPSSNATLINDFGCVLKAGHWSGTTDLSTSKIHQVATPSGFTQVTCSFDIPKGQEPRTAVSVQGFTCNFIDRDGNVVATTTDSRSVSTPGGKVNVTCFIRREKNEKKK